MYLQLGTAHGEDNVTKLPALGAGAMFNPVDLPYIEETGEMVYLVKARFRPSCLIQPRRRWTSTRRILRSFSSIGRSGLQFASMWYTATLLKTHSGGQRCAECRNEQPGAAALPTHRFMNMALIINRWEPLDRHEGGTRTILSVSALDRNMILFWPDHL
jgi:hypothetical protein